MFPDAISLCSHTCVCLHRFFSPEIFEIRKVLVISTFDFYLDVDDLANNYFLPFAINGLLRCIING